MPRPFKPAAPAQIPFQVFRGHAMEATHPFFQSAGIGVHVLNMIDLIGHPNPGGKIHGTMSNAQVLTGGSVRRGAVRTQNGVGRQHRFQHRFDMRRAGPRQTEIRRIAVPVPQQGVIQSCA